MESDRAQKNAANPQPSQPSQPSLLASEQEGALRWVYLTAFTFYALFVFRTSFVAFGTRYFVLFEDAMISMRYARNFADGFGLNWNAGEEPVEGYTNLLWTLWMSVFHKLGLSESKVSLPIMLTGIVILLSLGKVVGRTARALGATSRMAMVATTGVLFCYPLVFWTLRGMEVGAVSLLLHSLLLLALELEDRYRVSRALLMGALGAALVLLRSDSALSVGLIGLYAALTAPRGKRLMTLGLIGAMVAATVVGHTLFRLSYYHERLPNTAYLKLANIGTLVRVKRGVFVALHVVGFHLAVLLAAVLGSLHALGGLSCSPSQIWASVLAKREVRRPLLCATLIALQLTYAVYVGGDAWEWMLYANRYTSAAMPAFIVLVVTMVGRFLAVPDPTVRVRGVRAAAIVLGCAGLLLLCLNAYAAVAPEQGIARTIVMSKKTAAAGALYMVIGAFLFAAGSRLAARLDAVHAAVSERPFAALMLALAIFLPGQLEPLAYWVRNNAPQYHDEERYTRLGLLLARTTPKDFRIAVVAAGATPYFSGRPTEDMLGKNDKVIAKQSPSGVFSPGHDKWSYQHSFGVKKPDLIVEMADETPADTRYVQELGYSDLGNGLLYRRDGRSFDAALRSSFESVAELERALVSLPK